MDMKACVFIVCRKISNGLICPVFVFLWMLKTILVSCEGDTMSDGNGVLRGN